MVYKLADKDEYSVWSKARVHNPPFDFTIDNLIPGAEYDVQVITYMEPAGGAGLPSSALPQHTGIFRPVP